MQSRSFQIVVAKDLSFLFQHQIIGHSECPGRPNKFKCLRGITARTLAARVMLSSISAPQVRVDMFEDGCWPTLTGSYRMVEQIDRTGRLYGIESEIRGRLPEERLKCARCEPVPGSNASTVGCIWSCIERQSSTPPL